MSKHNVLNSNKKTYVIQSIVFVFRGIKFKIHKIKFKIQRLLFEFRFQKLIF